MRGAEELIQTLTSRGVRLWEEGGDLRFSAPKGAVTPELKGEMGQRKAELLALLRAASEAAHSALPPIRPRARGEPTPLSFAQQRLWFLDQLHPGNPAYNLAHAVRLQGSLDVEALQRALADIVRRHEILRTVFVAVDGVPTQVVSEPGSVELTLEDLTAGDDDIRGQQEWARHLLTREARRPFDLARGPLVRAHLWRLGADEHLLAVVMHHIVSDGWSEAVFANELTALYASFSSSAPGSPLADLPIQFGDYAAWQRQHADGAAAVHREYWRSTLDGAPTALDLVTDRPRPSTQTFAGDRIPLSIPAAVSQRLVKLAAEEATTPFVVILAAWAAVLGRHARQEDLVVGIPVANRERRELEPLIGFLVNTLAVRVDLSGGPAAMDLVRQVRRSMMEALEHQEVPFEQVVEDLRLTRDLSRPPLFQTMVAMVPSTPTMPPQGLRWSPEDVAFPFARLDLTLFIRGGAEEGLSGELEYNTDLFDRGTAERISAHLQRMLGAMTAEPNRAVASIPLMDSADRQQLLVEWNRTETSPKPVRCAHHLIEDQAQRTPDAVAVRSSAALLTYAQLDGAAISAAAALAAKGVQPGTVVGVCLRRTPDLLVTLLAIWKAGASFLPLDPSFPDERLAFMVEDAGTSLVIIDDDGEQALGRTVTVDELGSTGGDSFPGVPITPEALAYVMYTSGSSGRPKGVMIPHHGLVNYLQWCCDAYPVQEGAGAPVYTSMGFDATLTSLLVPLVAGGTVHLLPEDDDIEGLAAELRSPARYSFVKVTPAHLDVLNALVGDDIHPESTGCIIIGGEALLGRHLKAWRDRLPAARFINEYGPTETVVGCCVHELAPQDAIPPGRVPIGWPIANTRLFVLDDEQLPVPAGIPGELWVAGAGVGLGYVNRPNLSDEKFPRACFPEAEGDRIYRTGDLVRHRADGTLEYLGRIDDQINLNGFRIEPGEVEAALGEHTDVAECVVVTREGSAGRARLVAYYTGRPRVEISEKELLWWLRQRLPEFMVPTSLVPLEALPLTANGKVDRAALPASNQAKAAVDYVPPSS
ncbi:MAG: amino acid adenylation domain-containing protein, partial [Deltaproteobacteria bacterium]|nr:amino acid adenylation domain-containing protein [Deltaproteobacteria bacterium]